MIHDQKEKLLMTIEEMKEKRLQYLCRLYETVKGQPYELVDNFYTIGEQLGFSEELTIKIVQYLHDEKLVHAFGSKLIEITHKGLKTVEEALSNPNHSTDYFPPAINVISVGQMTNSQIVQASPGATQELTISSGQSEELINEIELLKEALKQYNIQQELRFEIDAEIRTIQEQLKSPKPKRKIISECVKSLRNVLEGALGSAIGTLLTKAPTLFSMIGG